MPCGSAVGCRLERFVPNQLSFRLDQKVMPMPRAKTSPRKHRACVSNAADNSSVRSAAPCISRAAPRLPRHRSSATGCRSRPSPARRGIARVGLVEDHALGDKLGLQRAVHVQQIGALLDGCCVKIVVDDSEQVGRQTRKRPAVGDDPIAAPAMVRQRAIFLDLIELAGRNLRQRVFLAFDDMGLQRRIEFAVADAGGQRAEA